MRASYRAICVKFREDDPMQIHAWEYLRAHAKGTSYSALIAEAIASLEEREEAAGTDDSCMEVTLIQEQMNRIEQTLLNVQSICTGIRDDAGRSCSHGSMTHVDAELAGDRENRQREDKYRDTVLDFALGMGGEV